MKVCLLTTSFPHYKGHIQSPFIYHLCTSLVKQGASVEVVTPRHGDSLAETTMDGVKVHRFSYFNLPFFKSLTGDGGIPSNLKSSFVLTCMQLFFLFVAYFFSSLKYAKKADVIHAQWSFSALVGVFLKKLYGKPLILTERGASANLAFKNLVMRKVQRWVLKQCDFVTANNSAQLAALAKEGVSTRKLAVVPNGIDTKLFAPKSKQACRKQLKMSLKQPVLLFVGWLIPRKGVAYLLKALVAVKKKYPTVRCYIVGEGREEANLKHLTQLLGLTKQVTFLQPQPQNKLPLYYNAADLLVLPSLSEGRPNVVGEALACGTPVIATNVQGTAEYFDLLNYGTLVPPKQITKLSNALSKGLRISWKLPKKQHIHFRNSFSWTSCAKAYIVLYKRFV